MSASRRQASAFRRSCAKSSDIRCRRAGYANRSDRLGVEPDEARIDGVAIGKRCPAILLIYEARRLNMRGTIGDDFRQFNDRLIQVRKFRNALFKAAPIKIQPVP